MGLGASSASLSSPEKPPQSKDFIRWGIVGLGDVCAQKAGPAFWKCDGAELVAVMRRTPGAAAVWARENVPGDQCTGYDDLKTFLQHPGLDAVYIATPPGAHLAVARQVAAAGLACYVEKPVGRCAAETEEMAKMFAAAGQKLFPAYVSRAHERTVAIRALLAEGVVGDRVTCVRYMLRGTGGARGLGVEEAVLPWRLDAAQSGGGLVMDVGCHIVDRLDYLLGPLTGVTGTAQNRASPRQAVEDYVQLRATVGPCDWAPVTAEGAAVTCTWDFTPAWGEGGGEEEVDELVIEGPGGSLVTAGMGAAAPVSVRDAAGREVRRLAFAAPAHAAQPLVQAATDELLGRRGARCPADAAGALRAARALDAALEGYYGGRGPGYWERPEGWPGRQRRLPLPLPSSSSGAAV